MLFIPDAVFSNRMQYYQAHPVYSGCSILSQDAGLLQAEGNILLACSKTSIRFV